MGWFNKKEKKEVPSLPELPKLPKLPKLEENSLDDSKIHQLPSFPTNSLGEKFSQNTIKEAIEGDKKGGEVPETDDFEEDNLQIMQKPLKKSPIPKFSNLEKIKGIPFEKRSDEISKDFVTSTKKAEPVFIRIDKFEESLKIFDKTKEKISKIENILREIKHIKENEERELKSWEEEIDAIKQQIEKVDKNIFSKI